MFFTIVGLSITHTNTHTQLLYVCHPFCLVHYKQLFSIFGHALFNERNNNSSCLICSGGKELSTFTQVYSHLVLRHLLLS